MEPHHRQLSSSSNDNSNFNNKNVLFTSIPIIQKVMSFTYSKKLSNPIKLAQVCSAWNETCHDYGGGSLTWLHEAQKGTSKSRDRLIGFLHKACSASHDVTLWVVEQLLQLGVVDPSSTDRAGFQGIHFCARYGNVRTLDTLLFNHIVNADVCKQKSYTPVNIHAATKREDTVFSLVLETKNKELLQFLIKRRNLSVTNFNPETGEILKPTELTPQTSALMTLKPPYDHFNMMYIFQKAGEGVYNAALDAFIEHWNSVDDDKCCFEPIFDYRCNQEYGLSENVRSESFDFFSNNNDDGSNNNNNNNNLQFFGNDQITDQDRARGIIAKYDTGKSIRNIKKALKKKYNTSGEEILPDVLFRSVNTHRTLLSFLVNNSFPCAAELMNLFPDRCNPLLIDSSGRSAYHYFFSTTCSMFVNKNDPDNEDQLLASVKASFGAKIVPTPAQIAAGMEKYQTRTDFAKLLHRVGEHHFKLMTDEIRCADDKNDDHDDDEVTIKAMRAMKAAYDKDPRDVKPPEKLIELPVLAPGGMKVTRKNFTPFLDMCSGLKDKNLPNRLKFLVDVFGANPRVRVPFYKGPPRDDDDDPVDRNYQPGPNYGRSVVDDFYSATPHATTSTTHCYKGHSALDIALSFFEEGQSQKTLCTIVTCLVEMGVDPHENHPITGWDFFKTLIVWHSVKKDILDEEAQTRWSRFHHSGYGNYFGYFEKPNFGVEGKDPARIAVIQKQANDHKVRYGNDFLFENFVKNIKAAITLGFQYRKENGHDD